MKFTSLLPRVGTGILLISLLGLAVYYGVTWLSLLAGVFVCIALWEFYSLFWPGSSAWGRKLAGLILGTGFIAAGWAEALLRLEGGGSDLLPLACVLSVLVLSVLFLIHFSLDSDAASIPDYGLIVFGIMYVAGPVMFALHLSQIEILLLFAVTIATDTAAYFVGNLCGKHKVWSKVSPNKSVEGCLGGLAGSVLVCVAFAASGHMREDSMGMFALLGCFLGLAAMAGDFFESALKRKQEVKDSGCLLPGHGGVLDRIDSFLFVVPAYVAFHVFEGFLR